MIRHIVFPQPLIPHITRPFSFFSKTPGLNIPKYELECVNAARLLALKSNSNDKNLGTFLSATETVGLDEDLHCADPIRASMSFSMIHSLRNVPNTYHLPKKFDVAQHGEES